MTAITDMVDLEVQDGIAVIRINNPPVNALSRGVRDGLYEAVKKADADDQAKAILIICEGRTYIAGADIKEFGKPQQGVSLFDACFSTRMRRFDDTWRASWLVPLEASAL